MSSRLSWSQHGDALGIAVLAHRAAALGHPIHLTPDGYAGPDSLALAARQAGLAAATVPGDGASLAQDERALALPRIVLYCGAAIGYPYYAYYSHCLWSLGLPYRRATAADIAGGMLASADVLILPGGFATWGLDRIEGQPGIDDEIRAFLARGGAGIGSCGGAYYFSQGRPHWLGVLDAKPRYTHEYLYTGAGLLNVRLDDAELRRDLPETMELAYYHGPVYEPGHRRARTGATFESHIMSTRLFIDNPLDADRFDRIMRDRPAILSSTAPHGRVVGFSPHPEMGEFLRKAMALDGYVRKYLPIRGRKTMDETLRFYATEDCLSFRLVLNAALMLGAFDGNGRSAGTADPEALAPASKQTGWAQDLSRAVQAWRAGADGLASRLADEEPELADLMGDMLRALRDEWESLAASAEAQGWSDDALSAELGLVLEDAILSLQGPPRRAVEMMVLLELPVRLLAAVARIARFDRIVKELM
ncbi:MAG TPA: hypothetical protein VL522_07410 [Bordetella sp.]|jgi:hypothetical protein|nr:hypothetical protein [Bordetella sp.]